MSKITIEFEDTEDGQVAVGTTISEFSETSPAAQMATRVVQYIDAIASMQGEGQLLPGHTPAIRGVNGRKLGRKATIVMEH